MMGDLPGLRLLDWSFLAVVILLVVLTVSNFWLLVAGGSDPPIAHQVELPVTGEPELDAHVHGIHAREVVAVTRNGGEWVVMMRLDRGVVPMVCHHDDWRWRGWVEVLLGASGPVRIEKGSRVPDRWCNVVRSDEPIIPDPVN